MLPIRERIPRQNFFARGSICGCSAMLRPIPGLSAFDAELKAAMRETVFAAAIIREDRSI
jgi:hypothetical protein